jgi:hypothetical protein
MAYVSGKDGHTLRISVQKNRTSERMPADLKRFCWVVKLIYINSHREIRRRPAAFAPRRNHMERERVRPAKRISSKLSGSGLQNSAKADACVYRKPRPGRNGDEVHPE